MGKIVIHCGEKDYTSLSEAFSGEFESDCDLSLEVVFVNGDEIQTLNREYRKVDSVTDVLSFPMLDGIFGKKISKDDFPYDLDEEGNIVLGSIAICLDKVKEQAQEYLHSEERELYYLTAHGILHLLGYDHIEENDKKIMREKEEKVLAKLSLSE